MSQHRPADWVTLSGYVVDRISPSGAAVGLKKKDTLTIDTIWFPVSQIMDGDEVGVGDEDLVVRGWLAEVKGLDF